MANWTVGGATYSDPAGLSDGTGLRVGRYWCDEVRVSEPRYEQRTYSFPGVDGVGLKKFGFRGRTIKGTVVYVESSAAAVRAAVEADRTALANETFSTTPPGGTTLTDCLLRKLPDGPLRTAGGGLYFMRTELTLRQLRE